MVGPHNPFFGHMGSFGCRMSLVRTCCGNCGGGCGGGVGGKDGFCCCYGNVVIVIVLSLIWSGIAVNDGLGVEWWLW